MATGVTLTTKWSILVLCIDRDTKSVLFFSKREDGVPAAEALEDL